jgi:hypothetical protein
MMMIRSETTIKKFEPIDRIVAIKAQGRYGVDACECSCGCYCGAANTQDIREQETTIDAERNHLNVVP